MKANTNQTEAKVDDASSSLADAPLHAHRAAAIIHPRMARKTGTISTSQGSTAMLGFEAKLWLTADNLRNNMDAAE